MSLSGFRDSQQEIPTLHTPLLGTATYRTHISILVDITDCRIFHLNKQVHKFVLEVKMKLSQYDDRRAVGPIKINCLTKQVPEHFI